MMTYPFENRMAVEGQREYEERYGGPDRGPDLVSYCEVCKCKDCPRYGDDCDGNDEEDDDDDRIAYYERQGDEYVYYDENEHELFREPV